MPIETICTHCGQKLRAADTEAGTHALCPKCGFRVTIPYAASPTPQDVLVAEAVDDGNAYRSPVAAGWQGRPLTNLGDDPAIRMLLPVGRSALAIAAGYAGLFAALCFPAPIALVLGILAIRDIQSHPEKHGMGRAVFAVVMGVVFTVILVFVGFAMVVELASQ